jgi:hypothetical protein
MEIIKVYKDKTVRKKVKSTPILNDTQDNWLIKHVKPLLSNWEWNFLNKYYLNKE